MFERYSERARRAIFYARWWALNRKSAQIETSDLILGATQVSRGEDSLFQWMKLDYDLITSLFAADVTPVAEPQSKGIPLSDSSKRALAYSAMEVNSDNRYSLEVYHIVRGVLRTGDQTAQRLAEAGVDLEAFRLTSREANKRVGDARFRLRLKTSLQRLRWRLGRNRLLMVCVALSLFAAAVFYLRSQN